MNVENLMVCELREYENNTRIHSAANVRKIVASIREYGFTVPVLVDADGVIIAGHGRVAAAREIGLEFVPCIRLANLTPEQVAAYRIADNRLAGDSEWDEAALAAELAKLGEVDVSVAALSENVPILGDDGAVVFEPELQADGEEVLAEADFGVRVAKRGQIWRLGEHRLMCGDCTSVKHMTMLMGEQQADIVFTDPPYGVAIGDKNVALNDFQAQKGGRCTENIDGDTLAGDDLRTLLTMAFTNLCRFSADHCSIYVTFTAGENLHVGLDAMRDAGIPVRHTLAWVKNAATFSIGRLDYDYQHEVIFFTWGKNHKRVRGGKQQTSTWFYNKPLAAKLHPTMKPIALIENAILNSSEEGDVLLDVFAGSGSSLIAAHETGRVCFAMEIDPHYVDVIIRRWQEHTGMEATLESGETFAQCESELTAAVS